MTLKPRDLLVGFSFASAVAVAITIANFVPSYKEEFSAQLKTFPISKTWSYGWPFADHWVSCSAVNAPSYGGGEFGWTMPKGEPEWGNLTEYDNDEAWAYNRIVVVIAAVASWGLASAICGFWKRSDEVGS